MAQKFTYKKSNKRGVTMIMATCCLVFMVPMAGLAIDVGLLYVVKAKLQAAVDGAALAAARALSIGQDLSAQTDSAKNNAVNWFTANFPPGNFFTTNTVMTASNVTVANDANNAQLRNVSVTATTRVGTIFMKWFNIPWTVVGASGTASRRTVVAMLVLDRSGSMCRLSGSTTDLFPCTALTQPTSPCATMIGASKLFTGQFAANSDYIGLLSFGDTTYLHSVPTQNFQTTLGYHNNAGSGTGAIDTISCDGFTNTAQAISQAYQVLAQMNLPGALNVIVLETDGLPNSLTMNFWDSAHSAVGLTNVSTCTDKNGLKKSTSGFLTTAAIPAWTNGISMTASPFLTNSYGPYNTNIPNQMVGVVESDDPGYSNNFYLLGNYWSNPSSTPGSQSQSSASYYSSFTYTSAAAGCAFNYPAAAEITTNPADLAWFPATDVYGNAVNPSLNPYKSVTTDGSGHLTQNGWQNFHDGAINATDNAAYRARNNTANVNIGKVTFFVVGLGGNGSGAGVLDDALLQRIANDPSADTFNNPATYSACAQVSHGCWTYSDQPYGTYIYAPSQANLGEAFLRISSQVLRLSK